MQDGSLVPPPMNSTVATSLQTLPSVQAGGDDEVLPSVVSGPTVEGGGGTESSSGDTTGGSEASSDAIRLPQIQSSLWFGAAVMLFVCVW